MSFSPLEIDRNHHAAERSRLIAIVFMIVFSGLAIRALQLTFDPAYAISKQKWAHTDTHDVVRADIYDRNGVLLATSLPSYSLYANPRDVWDVAETVHGLMELFPDINPQVLTTRLLRKDRRFVWVKRGLTPAQKQAAFELGLPGLGFRDEIRRIYPHGQLAGHVLGGTNLDGQGIAGIEYAHNESLIMSDAGLKLTLDINIQHAAEEVLEDAVIGYLAEAGSVLVVDARQAEILAMASWPPADPNRFHSLSDAQRLNRATASVYELGSVFKPFTVSAALETGVTDLAETINIAKPLKIKGAMIKDHPMPKRHANLFDIIAWSSNVGVVTLSQKIGPRRQRDFLQDLNLLSRTSPVVPENASPLLPPEWDDLTSATVSYGHGLAVTPLSFVTAFAAFANDGEFAPLVLTRRLPGQSPPWRRAMSTPTAQTVRAMMRDVVKRGTGRRLDAGGYLVAGKTGTAHKVVNGVYDEEKRVSSFAAVFPTEDPQYVALIVLDEPKEGILIDGVADASRTAAPAMGRLIKRIGPLLKLSPLEPKNAPFLLEDKYRTVDVSMERSL